MKEEKREDIERRREREREETLPIPKKAFNAMYRFATPCSCFFVSFLFFSDFYKKKSSYSIHQSRCV